MEEIIMSNNSDVLNFLEDVQNTVNIYIMCVMP